MLTFFRRIRKEFLGSGRTRKYFLFAIGEIALVVIGILIALQINNWNEWRKDRVVEEQILKDLKKALTADIEEQIIPNLWWVSNDISNINTIITTLENKLPYQDTLSIQFRSLMTSKSFRWEITAYKNLENEGLDIFTNPALKDEIVRLYNMNYPKLEYRISNFSNNLMEFFRPEMHEKFRYVHSEGNRNRYVPINYEALLDDVKVMNNLNTARINFISIQNTLEETKSKVEEIIAILDNEFNE